MRHIFTTAFNDSPVGRLVEQLLAMEMRDRAYIETLRFRSEDELQRLLGDGQCDLLFAYLSDVSWNPGPGRGIRAKIQRLVQLFHRRHPGRPLLPLRLRRLNVLAMRDNVLTGTRALTRIHSEHLTPVIASQGLDLRKEFEATGVWFFQLPFTVEPIREALRRVIAERLQTPTSPPCDL